MSPATTIAPSKGTHSGRVVQVYPTLRCNLSCAHCYSASGPEAGSELEPKVLIERLAHLRREGYDLVSFSGGEPFLYWGFDHVAAEARRMGFRVHATSNGMLLSRRRIAPWRR